MQNSKSHAIIKRKGGDTVIPPKNKIFTKEDIFNQLEKFGAPKDSVVLVNSSYRLVGNFEGGAEKFLDALVEFFTAKGGLLCIPTHTWHNIDKDISLDMNDPSTCLGLLPDIAAKDTRGVRTQNPTHSMVVFGNRDRVHDFVKDESKVSSGTDPIGCHGKLYRENGYVLLVGVAHDKNTYLHCVDEMLNTPNRMDKNTIDLTVKLREGELVTTPITPLYTDFTDDISLRFPKYETAFRYHGAITDGFLGNAPTQLCSARIMKETMELIAKRSGENDPLADEFALSPKLYC